MKKIFLSLAATLLFIQAHADSQNKLENVYVKAANTLLFFTSEDIIGSGFYTLGGANQTLKTTFFPLVHHFKNDSNFYNFYINGSVGYSKYKEKNIDFRGSIDDLAIKTYALKFGGGVRLKFTQDVDMMLGTSYIYSKVDSEYHTPQPLDSTDSADKALDDVFNSSNTFHTMEWFASMNYHPAVNEYKPYVHIDMRYFDTNIADPLTAISDTTSTISKLKVGVLTPPVISIKGLPLRLEFYASDVFLSGDMREALDTNNFYVLGTTFHLDTTTLNDWVSDVSFDVNIVRGDNVDGFNFGVGLSF